MEIIIDIPEERLKSIKAFGINQNEIYMFEKALMNGTPLPKGHGDLIDVSKKVMVQLYNDQYEEYIEEEMTIKEYLNRFTDAIEEYIVVRVDQERD